MYSEDYYITEADINCKLLGVKIFLFGLSLEATQFLEVCPSTCEIGGFIDNNRVGGVFEGETIIGLNEYKRDSNAIILITTNRYMRELFVQLENEGYIPGQDFFVWDNSYLYHRNQNIEKYIIHNKRIWTSYKKTNKDKEILIACDNRCDISPTVYGYCANYLSQKCDARIVGYARLGNSVSNISDNMKRIYESINVSEIIDYSLSNKQQRAVYELGEKIWTQIDSWEDWDKIKIYNIHFGTSIIRTIMRLRVPDFDPKSQLMKQHLLESLGYIVFWHDYFQSHNVETVLLGDGVNWDSYIREIAINQGINSYSIEAFRKLFANYYENQQYRYYHDFWNSLSKKERVIGREWAKQHIDDRIKGSMEDIPNWISDSVYRIDENVSEIKTGDASVKMLICPHIFEEDSIQCGKHIFDNNYISWLMHLGELSNEIKSYEWYIKIHPDSERLDEIIMEEFLKRYPRIKCIDRRVSPHQIKKAGIEYALTVFGSIGHEYPALGITVINAGDNPGSSFEFNINPKTKEEFDDVIKNISKYKNSQKIEDLYRFYCIHYLFYDREYYPYLDIFFDNSLLKMDRYELKKHEKTFGPWIYKVYLEEFSEERHEFILEKMEEIFDKMQKRNPQMFYKSRINLDMLSKKLGLKYKE